jgi:spore coat protein CotH
MRVVINGESWGVYANQQKFDKEWARDFFGTTKGVRWRSPNNSTGGGFGYLGDDLAVYKKWYTIKSKDDPKAWTDLANLCKVLNQTPPDKLAKALEPILDVDNALAWMAIDVSLINNDGYWNDGSDFAIYQDVKGRFHVLPHDANEGFRGGGKGGVKLDPFVATADVNKAMRNKMLAVPELRTKYLRYVKDIAENWLDWKKMGPIVDKYKAMIDADVQTDTHKHHSTAEFIAGIYGKADGSPAAASTIKGFCEQRGAFLLNHPDIKTLAR